VGAGGRGRGVGPGLNDGGIRLGLAEGVGEPVRRAVGEGVLLAVGDGVGFAEGGVVTGASVRQPFGGHRAT